MEMTRQAVGLSGEENEREGRATLSAALSGVRHADAVVERLAPLVGLGGTPASAEDGFRAVRAFLAALAEAAPLVLVFDDVHWAEPTLLDLNPRDGLPFSGKLVNRHRLIRRGLPYGPPLPKGAPDDGEDRGIIFMCFNADITRQFEFVQAQWVNDGNAFRLGDERDVIAGSVRPEGGRLTVEGTPPRSVPLRRAVQVKGGEYFFMPVHRRPAPAGHPAGTLGRLTEVLRGLAEATDALRRGGVVRGVDGACRAAPHSVPPVSVPASALAALPPSVAGTARVAGSRRAGRRCPIARRSFRRRAGR